MENILGLEGLQFLLQGAMQAELLAKDAELQSASAAAQQAVAEADSRAATARKEAENWAREAEDRRMQLSVLMETLETLQAGSMGQPLLPLHPFCFSLCLHCSCVSDAPPTHLMMSTFEPLHSPEMNMQCTHACHACICQIVQHSKSDVQKLIHR